MFYICNNKYHFNVKFKWTWSNEFENGNHCCYEKQVGIDRYKKNDVLVISHKRLDTMLGMRYLFIKPKVLDDRWLNLEQLGRFILKIKQSV